MGDSEGKGVKCCQKARAETYYKILHWDLFFLAAHCLAAFVLYNYLVFIPVVLIRVPRLVLALVTRYSPEEGIKYEVRVRFVTMLLSPVCSLVV